MNAAKMRAKPIQRLKVVARKRATTREVYTAALDLHIARDALRRAWTHLDASSRAAVDRMAENLFWAAVELECPAGRRRIEEFGSIPGVHGAPDFVSTEGCRESLATLPPETVKEKR